MSTSTPASFGPLTRTDIVRYAGASTDFNPMHHDDEFARATGMPSVFAHGMLSAGLLASHLEAWVGDGRILSFQVRFAAQVWPGDTLVPRLEVVDRDGPRTRLEIALERTEGGAAVTGTALVELDQKQEQQ